MENLRDKYEVVIGLEVHAQLKTKSKRHWKYAAPADFCENIPYSPTGTYQ